MFNNRRNKILLLAYHVPVCVVKLYQTYRNSMEIIKTVTALNE